MGLFVCCLRLPSSWLQVPIRRSDDIENKLKRLLIKSHYLLVANAAVRSCISGGLAGLIGSQASKISIATSSLTCLCPDLADGGLKVSFIGSRSKARRPEASGPSCEATTKSAITLIREIGSKRRNIIGTKPSTAACERLHQSEPWRALQT